ncbi:MAG: nucleotidyltransferase family protein [bacterium]
MNLKAIREKWRTEILRLGERHGACNIRVFGSIARNEEGSESDLDLLVDMEKDRSYLDLVGFWQDLEELLGCRVDVISEGGISPYLQDQIHREAIPF